MTIQLRIHVSQTSVPRFHRNKLLTYNNVNKKVRAMLIRWLFKKLKNNVHVYHVSNDPENTSLPIMLKATLGRVKWGA